MFCLSVLKAREFLAKAYRFCVPGHEDFAPGHPVSLGVPLSLVPMVHEDFAPATRKRLVFALTRLSRKTNLLPLSPEGAT